MKRRMVKSKPVAGKRRPVKRRRLVLLPGSLVTPEATEHASNDVQSGRDPVAIARPTHEVQARPCSEFFTFLVDPGRS